MLNNYPGALKKKILMEIGACVASLIFLIIVSVVYKNFVLSLPIIAIALFFGFIAGHTIYSYEKGKIISVEGNCVEVLRSIGLGRTTTVFIQADDKRVQIKPKERYKQYRQGDYIVVYINSDMEVYKEGDTYVLRDYIAMQITSVDSETETSQEKASNIIGRMLNKKKK